MDQCCFLLGTDAIPEQLEFREYQAGIWRQVFERFAHEGKEIKMCMKP